MMKNISSSLAITLLYVGFCLPLLFGITYVCVYIYINYFILPIILIIFFIYTCSIIIFQNMCFFPSLRGFFFQNNQIPQTISLVRKVLKLFRNLTNRICKTRFCSLKSSLLDLFFVIEIEPYRLDFSTPSARTTLLLQQSKFFFSNKSKQTQRDS